jgi:hypothetical protein
VFFPGALKASLIPLQIVDPLLNLDVLGGAQIPHGRCKFPMAHHLLYGAKVKAGDYRTGPAVNMLSQQLCAISGPELVQEPPFTLP